MESFKFWRKTLNFTIYTGEVLEQKTHIENNIYSRGGTKYTPLEVKSETITSKEVWLRMDDGSEDCFEFGPRFPLRVGQKATFIYAGTAGLDFTSPVAVINHTTGQYKILLTPGEINSQFKLYPMTGKTILFSFIIWWVGGYFLHGLGLQYPLSMSAACAFLFLLYRYMTKVRRMNSLGNSLGLHIEKCIADIFEKNDINPA
ncbi:hypothetical protein ACK39S_19980 [Aeromonas veronii]